MKTRHVAVAAGLAISIVFGGAQISSIAFAEQEGTALVQGADAASAAGTAEGELPAPADYDRTDFYEEAPVAVPMARSARAATSSLSPVSLSSEMKYFTQYESHGNYRQGFSYGDGYNALGYYQFDRRYSLIPFLRAVYSYDPVTYAMLGSVLDRADEVSSKDASMYDAGTKTLSELGRLVQDAWYAAYDANPSEFSALQDSYAYNNYYVVTESWLASQGIDLSGRADCVKGMVWGLTNMWGTGGVRPVLAGANLSDDMTDREFVTALATQMTDHIAKYSAQTQYYKGWTNRYRNELDDCLAYIAAHEAAASGSTAGSEPDGGGSPSTPGGSADGSTGSTPGGATDGITGSTAGSADGEGSGSAPGGAANGTQDGSTDGIQGGAEGSLGDSAGSSGGDAAAGGAESGDATGAGAEPGGSSSTPDGTGTTSGGAVSGSASVRPPAMAPQRPAAESDGGEELPAETVEADGAERDNSGGTDSEAPAGQDPATGGTDDAAPEARESADAPDEDGADGGKGAGSAHDDAATGDGEQGAERMPQTSDLVVVMGLASASLATLGATAVMAGGHGLSHRDRDGE